MKPGKKSKLRKGIAGEATVRGLELGILAIAAVIVVLVPVVVDTDMILVNPAVAYHPLKLKVLMGFSAALLVAVLGVVVLCRRKPLGVPVLIPVLAFLGVSALSTLLSENPSHSLFGDRYDGLLSLAGGVLLFYAVARVLDSPLRVRIFLAAGVAAAVLVSVFGISQKYGLDMISGWGSPWYVNLIERPFSTVGNPITLASYLTLMMGAAVALCFKAGSWVGRAPWLFALAVIGACWLYTDTRAAMLSVGVALPVVLWFALRRMGTVRPLLVPLAILIAGMAAAIVAAAVMGNLTLHAFVVTILASCLALMTGMGVWLFQRGRRKVRFLLVTLAILVVAGIATVAAAVYGNFTLSDRLTTSLISDPNVQVRLLTWRDTIPMILERPLLGHGPDNFTAPFIPHLSEDLAAVNTGRIDKAHNDILQVAATTGLLGLAAYLWLFVAYFRNVYQRGGWPLIALSGGVLAYLIQLQTSFPSIDTNVAFWGILGASVAVMRLHDRESEEEPEAVGTESVGAALNVETPRKNIYELLVVVIVVGSLVAVAVPTFLEQREVTATFERAKVTADVVQTVSVYEQIKAQSGTYLEDGVYYQSNPIKVEDTPLLYPSRNVVINVTTTPAGGLTVEGVSTTLAGTVRCSYGGATSEIPCRSSVT